MSRSHPAIGAAVFLYVALSVPANFSGEPCAGGRVPGGRASEAREPERRGLGAPLSKRSLHTAALTRSYGGLIEKVELRGDDVVFTVRGKEIHYREGRMLSEGNLSRAAEFDSIFYEYGTDPAKRTDPVRPFAENQPRNSVSDDFPDALVGSTEREVRASCRWVDFLDHRVFVHSLCAEALERVDSRIRERAATSAEVRDYIARIKVVFSMKRRYVRGTTIKSYHAYGLALDVIPSSYGRKAVYWRWSAVLTDGWGDIPPSERWHPPQAVIDAFEENGFVWGGKWHRFDTVHFEYRPEILVSPASLSTPASLTPSDNLTPRRE